MLSPRERDVLYELARGSTYADIAANLFVSENTVKTHVSSLYGKLSVNRRSAALAAARDHAPALSPRLSPPDPGEGVRPPRRREDGQP